MTSAASAAMTSAATDVRSAATATDGGVSAATACTSRASGAAATPGHVRGRRSLLRDRRSRRLRHVRSRPHHVPPPPRGKLLPRLKLSLMTLTRAYSGQNLQLERKRSEKFWVVWPDTQSHSSPRSLSTGTQRPRWFPKLCRGRQKKAPARSDTDRG